MSTATLVRDNLKGFTGHAALYRLDPPIAYTDWSIDDELDQRSTSLVVVSAVTLPMGLGSETYIFPGNEDGTVADWGELPGSLKHTLSHAEALAAAGYEVKP